MKNSSRISLLLLAFMWLFVGCASLDTLERYEYQFEPEDGLFPPVRLYFNREQALSPQLGAMINALRSEIYSVGAFMGAGAFSETPFAIDMQLSWETDMSAGSFAGMMVSAASLGVVPSRHRQQYRLEVAVYVDGMMIDSFTLEEEATSVMSAYNYVETVEGDVHRQSMGNLARRLVEQLVTNHSLPRSHSADWAAVRRAAVRDIYGRLPLVKRVFGGFRFHQGDHRCPY